MIIGSLLAIGGSSQFADRGTNAFFSDSQSAVGTIVARGEPTLDYQVQDQIKYDNPAYKIYYQVEWVSNLDHIEIHVENLDREHEQKFHKSSAEGSVSYSSGGANGSSPGDTYQFTFTVYGDAGSGPTQFLQKTATDTAGGGGTGDGDFGGSDSATIDWIIVRNNLGNSGADYDVYYQISNHTDDHLVRCRFLNQNPNHDWATKELISQDMPTGRLSYSEGGTEGDPYDIAIELENPNGLIVDDQTITDEADGTDPEKYGAPALPDSPKLESFTITDSAQNNSTDYILNYQTTNHDRFGGAHVTFKDTEKASATQTVSTDSSASSGSVTYNSGDTVGHTFEITVEIFETREGITFPIDSGTVTDVSDGGTSKSWPENAS